LTPPADDTDDRLGAMLAEFGADNGLELRVYHVVDGKRGFLFTLDASEAADAETVLAMLSERAGDGDYELWVKNRGSRSIVRKVPVSIGRIQPRGRLLSVPNVTPPPAPVSRDTSPIGDPTLRAILETQTKLLERLLAAPPAAAAAPKSTLEVARELAELKDLFAPPAQSQNVLEMIRDVLTIRKELQDADDGGDPPDPLTTAIKTLGPSIVEGVRALQERKGSRLARALERKRETSAPAKTEGDAMSPAMILKGYLPSVLELARAGVTPNDAAARIVAQLQALPGPLAEQVLMYLDDLDGADLVKLEPAVAPFEQWFNDTLDGVFDIVAPEEPAPAADDTAASSGVGSAATEARRPNGEQPPRS
jgi:hypothetical protein